MSSRPKHPSRAAATALAIAVAAGTASIVSSAEPQAPEEEVTSLRKRAESGNARAQAEIGYLHYKQDTAAERAEGLKWITAAARQGDTYALTLLAYHYRHSSEPAERKFDRVLDLSIRGAQLGDTDALGTAAVLLYRRGKRDPGEVLQLLEEAGS
jgi:TPR repeat protein